MLNFCSCGSMESNHDSRASSGRRASCARATGAGRMRDIRFAWYRPIPTKGRSTEYRFLDLQDYRITIFESVVLINLDLRKFEISNISFEHLHLNFWEKIRIIYKFIKCGYFFSGMGFDLRKSDWMFTKDYKSKRLRTILLPITPRRIWKKYSFSDQM